MTTINELVGSDRTLSHPEGRLEARGCQKGQTGLIHGGASYWGSYDLRSGLWCQREWGVGRGGKRRLMVGQRKRVNERKKRIKKEIERDREIKGELTIL